MEAITVDGNTYAEQAITTTDNDARAAPARPDAGTEKHFLSAGAAKADTA